MRRNVRPVRSDGPGDDPLGLILISAISERLFEPSPPAGLLGAILGRCRSLTLVALQAADRHELGHTRR